MPAGWRLVNEPARAQGGHALKILLTIVANAVALYATTQVVPGISWSGSLAGLLVAGAVFGLLNLVVRPIAMFLALPFIVLTLGLFYFVMNGLLLLVFSWFMPTYRVRRAVGRHPRQPGDHGRQLADLGRARPVGQEEEEG